ncbi:MAG: hypothetical protein V4458_06040 [Pseudomonadota bacterium]
MPAQTTADAGRTVHTPGPWRFSGHVTPVGGEDGAIDMLWCGDVRPPDGNKYRGQIASIQSAEQINGIAAAEAEANARLIAAAPDLLKALKQIRLWLAVEGCWEQMEIADAALLVAGETDVACTHCSGAGEWDEGPLPATSSAQIDPEYRHVKCPECEATGRVALSRAKEPDAGLTDAEQRSQGRRCGCLGSDDYCVCQNAPDHITRAERSAAAKGAK